VLRAAAGRLQTLFVLPHCMTPSKLLATVLLGLGVVSAQKGGKACNQSFCLTVKIEDDRIICEHRRSHLLRIMLRVRCNVDYEDRRWMDGRVSSVVSARNLQLTACCRGFGQQMADTHMVMMWNSTSSTTTTLSQRFGFGLSEPMLVPRPPIRAETVVDINTMKSMMNVRHRQFNCGYRAYICLAFSWIRPSPRLLSGCHTITTQLIALNIVSFTRSRTIQSVAATQTRI